jgi:hypothetical protein
MPASCRTLRLIAFALLSLFALPALGQGTVPTASGPPDANLYTSYYTNANYQNISYLVCGSTTGSEGCYGSGSIGPFGRVGAMIEGNPSITGGTVVRFVYVVDVASGTNSTGVSLLVYKKIDKVTSTYDTTTFTLLHTIALPLNGGTKAQAFMAANNSFLFIGTDQSPQAVEVQKSKLTVLSIGGFSPPVNVSAITANKYGFVAVTFGGSSTNVGGTYWYAPNGGGVQDGGGAYFLLDTINGVSTSGLPIFDAIEPLPVNVHPLHATSE